MAEESERGAERPRLALSLLGGALMALDGAPLKGFITLKSQALLCYLAVTGRPHSREALAALLWGDTPEEDAKASLRQVLSNLQKVAGPYLSITRQTVEFDRGAPYWLDVDAFVSAARAGSSHAIGAYRRLREAADLYAGDFLAGFHVRDAPEFDEWTAAQRERLRQLAFGALEQLAEHHARRGAYATASDYLDRLLQLDPWREDAHRQRMLLLYYDGRRDAALSQYASLRRVLQAELGEEPAEETMALYRRIRAGAVEHPAPPPARHNLPAQPTPLLGRQAELGRVTALLADPVCRLLTLVGPGGIGKTRLALQVAQELVDDFADGVFFVSLASIHGPDLVAQAIVDALKVEVGPGRPATERLSDWLKSRQVLLVLDNFEHLLPAATLIARLLAGCQALTVLATSRAPLHLRGEQVLPVPPLSLPDPGRADAPDRLADFASVALFLERARAVRPEFGLTPGNAAAIAAICCRLDGLPLAIELAAARIRLLSPEELITRLEQSIALLADGAEDLPPRQRTLRATIEWSYNLLSEPERTLFRRLAVFRDGATLDTVGAVCGPLEAGATTGGPDVDLLRLLGSLSDKSLVLRKEGPNAALRFTLLETIREYAAERLEASGEGDTVRCQHAVHFLALVEQVAPELHGPRQATRLEQLDAERANFSAALRWCAEHDPTTGLRLAAALWPFWLLRGYWGEGRGWLEALLQRMGSDAPAGIRAQASSAAGHLATHQGDTEAARALLLEGVAIRRELGDRRSLADALHWLGREYASPEAESWLREALALYRELGDERGIAEVLGSLGEHLREGGDLIAGRTLGEESLGRWRALGDAYHVALQLYRLGHIARHQGDDARARVCYDEALALNRRVGHRWGVAMVLLNLGFVEERAGDRERAGALARESLRLNRELGNKWGICRGLHLLAAVAVASAQPGAGHRAARLLGAAEALRLATGTTWQPHDRDEFDRWVGAARAVLDADTFAGAWAAGQALSPEEAVAIALEDGAPG